MKIIKASNKDVDILVDDEDFDELSKRKWAVEKNGYARAKINGKRVSMHRLVLDLSPKDPYVDHIDGNKVNNCKSNLRLVTPQQNQFNQRKREGCLSKYKGVTRSANKWMASIMINGKSINLGYYEKEDDAARAYNVKASEIFGEFAKLNDVDMSVPIPDVRQKSSSGFRGVYWNKNDNKWVAQIQYKNKKVTLGYFSNKNDAAIAYNNKAIELLGDKAKLNDV